MRTYFFYMLLSILLLTVGATSSQAQKMVAAVNTANATLPVKSVSETTDGMFNFKNFEVGICRTVGNGNIFTSSASALNLTQPGLYIFNVETTKDVYSNKVVVK